MCVCVSTKVCADRPTTETELNDPESHLAERKHRCQKLLCAEMECDKTKGLLTFP